MTTNRKGLFSLILIIICVAIHVYSLSNTRVEEGYSHHFYPVFSGLLRSLWGRLPFSIGDILYGLFFIWLIWKITRFIIMLVSRKFKFQQHYFKNFFYRLVIVLSGIYITFNLFWGINYNRQGIAWQLHLDLKEYSIDDLKGINNLLVVKINEAKMKLEDEHSTYPSNDSLFLQVKDAYQKLGPVIPFLQYSKNSLKSSMWGWLGNYTGFTGYYNPFTGEAQINTTVPRFLQPFIACHEVAHQLGYAKEMEANFVGYLAASKTQNPLFHYSVYLDLFIYANRNLFVLDSTASKIYRKQLSQGVIKDLKEWAEFNRKHQSIAEPVVRWIYGIYLKGNRQPEGILSYDEVTGFIIAYYKKYGTI